MQRLSGQGRTTLATVARREDLLAGQDAQPTPSRPSELLQTPRCTNPPSTNLYSQSMDRTDLGKLWLRWYVQRSDRTKPVGDIQAQHAEALQLRVSDVDDPAVWAALSEADPAHPEHSHVARILEYEERFEGVEAATIVLPAWTSPEGPVIIDGAHRACAIYRLEPVILEVDLLPFAAPPGHPDLLPGLRPSSPRTTAGE